VVRFLQRAALRRAQCWLRDATAERLAAVFDELQAIASNPEKPSVPDGTMIELALEGSIRFGNMNPNSRPYAEQPANWASFVYVGA
jgi:CHAT domain-containing protein